MDRDEIVALASKFDSRKGRRPRSSLPEAPALSSKDEVEAAARLYDERLARASAYARARRRVGKAGANPLWVLPALPPENPAPGRHGPDRQRAARDEIARAHAAAQIGLAHTAADVHEAVRQQEIVRQQDLARQHELARQQEAEFAHEQEIAQVALAQQLVQEQIDVHQMAEAAAAERETEVREAMLEAGAHQLIVDADGQVRLQNPVAVGAQGHALILEEADGIAAAAAAQGIAESDARINAERQREAVQAAEHAHAAEQTHAQPGTQDQAAEQTQAVAEETDAVPDDGGLAKMHAHDVGVDVDHLPDKVEHMLAEALNYSPTIHLLSDDALKRPLTTLNCNNVPVQLPPKKARSSAGL